MTNSQLINRKKKDYEKSLTAAGYIIEGQHIEWERQECYVAYKCDGTSRIEMGRFYGWGNGISCKCQGH
uniref:Uncharacterized protein n=1 Tax=viral metagenome TaxID=1070528 RepID=A0A6H1ZZ55_9ZZZZ